eukprot:3353-Amphidinium_carterae.2
MCSHSLHVTVLAQTLTAHMKLCIRYRPAERPSDSLLNSYSSRSHRTQKNMTTTDHKYCSGDSAQKGDCHGSDPTSSEANSTMHGHVRTPSVMNSVSASLPESIAR